MSRVHFVRLRLWATRLRGGLSFCLDRLRLIVCSRALGCDRVAGRHPSCALRRVSLEHDTCERDRWPMIAGVALLIARVESQRSKLSDYI